MPRNSRRVLRLALIVGVTAGFLWLFQRQTDLRAVLPALAELPAWSLCVSLGALLANLGFVALAGASCSRPPGFGSELARFS